MARRFKGYDLPGLSATQDPYGALFPVVGVELARHEPLFAEVMQLWGRGALNHLPASQAVVLSTILTEGIVHKVELLNFLSAATSSFSVKQEGQTDSYTFWTGADERQDARQLSPFTHISISRVVLPISWAIEIDRLETSLCEIEELTKHHVASVACTMMDALLRGGAAFLQRLPGSLHSHVTRLQPMTAVEPVYLARLAAGTPVRPKASAQEDPADAHAMQAIEQGSLRAAESDGMKINFALLEKLRGILTATPRPDRERDRALRITQVLKLVKEVHSEDAYCNLMLSWALWLLAVGSSTKADPTLRIVGRYFVSLNEALLDLDSGPMAPLNMEPAELRATYLSMIETAKYPDDCSAAIRSFHDFLMEYYDADPVYIRTEHLMQAPSPRRSMLCDADIRRLELEVVRSSAPERIKEMALVLLASALDLPMRTVEAFNLLVREVRRSGPDLFLDIRNHRRSFRTKSRSTPRTEPIHTDVAQRRLEAWKARRVDVEYAVPGDLLFGDASGGRADLATAYALLNRLMKVATGDPSVSFYSLRHTAITRLVDWALTCPAGTVKADVDPLDVAAARSGHAGAKTPLIVYYHLHFRALRVQLDRLVERHLTLAGAAAWSGLHVSSLSRRRASADTQRGDTPLVDAVRDAAHPISLGDPTSGFEAVAIPAAQDLDRNLSVYDALKLVTLIDAGHDAMALVGMTRLTEPEARLAIEARRDLKSAFPSKLVEPKWRQAKFAELIRRASHHPDGHEVVGAMASWNKLATKGYLALTDALSVDALLRIMCDSGMQASRMCIRAVDGESTPPREILQAFAAVFHHEPALESVTLRSWKVERPEVYLLISSRPYRNGIVQPSAASCMHGLHGLFVALHVRAAILGTGKRAEDSDG
jgi:integrase